MTNRIKDVFLDFVDQNGKRWERTPRSIIDAIHDAGEEMNYSNYHNGQFARAEEIIRRYCAEHKIPLGISKKQVQYQNDRRHKAKMRLLESGDIKKMNKALDMMVKLYD